MYMHFISARSRIQSLIVFSAVQKETCKTPGILDRGQLLHLSLGALSNR